MSYSTTCVTNNRGGKIWPLVALPGLVAEAATVQALHVDVLQGPVEHGQLVHVLGAEGNRLLTVWIVNLLVEQLGDALNPLLDVLHSLSGDISVQGFIESFKFFAIFSLPLFSISFQNYHPLLIQNSE